MGYKYCGPNTNLQEHLAHGERGINELDCACMEHDIAYTTSKDLEWRCNADKLLVLRGQLDVCTLKIHESVNVLLHCSYRG